MTVRINCDCSGNYMYWEWELATGLDDEVITGNGWVDANEATFDIDLPFYLSGSVPLYVEVFDAEGNHVTSNEYINLEKMVELEIDVPFYATVDSLLEIEWEITSRSLTEVDKASNIEIEMYSLESNVVLARNIDIGEGYLGTGTLEIPGDIKTGYLFRKNYYKISIRRYFGTNIPY